MPLLRVERVSKFFGGVVALMDVNLEIERGELFGIIGPNGAGKTTLFSTISGFLKPDRGAIYLKDRAISGLKPHQICKMGLVRTFQIPQPFAGFTAYDTLTTAALGHLSMKEARKKAEEVLHMVGLAEKKDLDVDALTAGDEKLLEIGKALASGGELILLDEAVAGLSLTETEVVMALVKRLSEEGITILMVEHVMFVIMNLCSRIAVLNFGSKIAEGSGEEISKNREVIQAYLGQEAEFAS